MWSYKELHEMAGRATTLKIMDYKTALQLYRTINFHITETDWVNLNLNAVNTSWQTTFFTNKDNRFKVGMSVFSNKAWCLNGKIKLDWFNLSYNLYKAECKKLLWSGLQTESHALSITMHIIQYLSIDFSLDNSEKERKY